MLKHRLITGPLLLALLLAIVIVDDRLETVPVRGAVRELPGGREHLPPGLALLALGLVVVFLAARELTAIYRANGVGARGWLTALAGLAGLVPIYALSDVPGPGGATDAATGVAIVCTCMVAVVAVALVVFSRGRNVQGVVAAAGAVAFTMVYLGLTLGLLVSLRREHSAWIVAGIVATTKACDTGAYLVGRSIGRHKLIPWLSPGKTWEGLAGGVIVAMAAGAALSWASGRWLGADDRVPVGLGAACGALFAVVGQLGDLAKSLLKRGAGIKDSSSMLPGLGGVLDVIDSPLLVAPVAWWVAAWALPA